MAAVAGARAVGVAGPLTSPAHCQPRTTHIPRPLTSPGRSLEREAGPAGLGRAAPQRGIGSAEELEQIPLRRFGEVEDCAGVLEFLVTDLSRYVTGQVVSVCGGAVLTPN